MSCRSERMVSKFVFCNQVTSLVLHMHQRVCPDADLYFHLHYSDVPSDFQAFSFDSTNIYVYSTRNKERNRTVSRVRRIRQSRQTSCWKSFTEKFSSRSSCWVCFSVCAAVKRSVYGGATLIWKSRPQSSVRDHFRTTVEPFIVKRYRKTLANRGFCKKKLDTRSDTHCIKTGVQLWCR